MKSVTCIFVALLFTLCACSSIRNSSATYSSSVREQIGKAILENRFTERELEYAALYEKHKAESIDPFDPFGGAIKDDRLTLIYEPYCVSILGKDPSSEFIKILDRRQHPIRLGSSFTPHPTKFATGKDRVNFELSNPPALFSISEIEILKDGRTAIVTLDIYRHGSNSEGWIYMLLKEDGLWTVVFKKMTYIS